MRFYLLFLLSLAAVVTGCSSDAPAPIGPASTDLLQVPAEVTIASDQQSASFQLTANCTWDILQQHGWDGLTVSPMHGSGPATIVVSSPSNPTTEVRTSALSVTTALGISTRIVLSQAAGEQKPVGQPPVVSQLAVTKDGKTTATASFVATTTTSHYPITQCGVWYATVSHPQGTGTRLTATPDAEGRVVVQLDDLALGKEYFVVAFATNEIGTTYSDEQSFSTFVLPGEEDNGTPATPARKQTP